MAKKTDTYGLVLHYPGGAVTIGLFDTAKAALEYAVKNPPPHMNDLIHGSDVGDRYQSAGVSVPNFGFRENEAPEGYTIQHYENGVPTEWAVVEPFHSRDAVLKEEESEKNNFDIDPDQELDFS